MAGVMDHDEAAALLGAYALDAVDPEERAAVDAHLASCPRCRAEVRAHQEVAALLGNSGAAAPEGVWERIAAGLEERPPALDLERVRQATRRAAEAAATEAAAGEAGPGEPAPGEAVAEGARTGARRRGPSRPRTDRAGVPYRAVAAALALAAAVIAILGIEVVRLHDRPARVPTAAAITLDRLVQDALVDPDARQVQLTGTDHAVLARAVIRPDGEAFLFDARMAALPAQETYQLWGQAGSDKISLALMGSAPTVVAFHVSPSAVTALMVTAEPAAGAVQPTGSVLASGAIPKSA